MLEDKLHPWAQAGLLPDFPFGTDLTDDELHIVRALKKLKHASAAPGRAGDDGDQEPVGGQGGAAPYLERLGLAEAHSFKDLFVRRLFAGNL